MKKSGITLEVLIDGRPVTEYTKDGLTYIEGRKGSEFSLLVRNRTSDKVLVVPSVDGLNTIDGEECTPDSRGYILGSYGSYEIKGWRTNNQAIRQFFFTRHKNAYASKVGENTDNLGAIGIMVFKDADRHNSYFPYVDYLCDSYDMGGQKKGLGSRGPLRAMSFSCSAGSLPEQSIGTGIGRQKTDRVRTSSFNRDPLPFVTLELLYYERRQLEQMGVVHKVVKQRPKAFPGFCREV